MDPHDGPVSAYQAAKAEIEKAEIDYNYCLYYPINEQFSPPPSALKRTIQRTGTATQQKRARIWNLTKKSLAEGTLEELRNGTLTATTAETKDQAPLKKGLKKDLHKETMGLIYSTFPDNLDSEQTQAFGKY